MEEGSRYRLGASPSPQQKRARPAYSSPSGRGLLTPQSPRARKSSQGYGSLGYINFVASPSPLRRGKEVFLADIDEALTYVSSRVHRQHRHTLSSVAALLIEEMVYNSNLWSRACSASTNSTTSTRSRWTRTPLRPERRTIPLPAAARCTRRTHRPEWRQRSPAVSANYQTNNSSAWATLSVQVISATCSATCHRLYGTLLRNKPISLGFQVFSSKYDYNAANYQISTGAEPDRSSRQNYNQSSSRLTVQQLSSPRFHRIGLTIRSRRARLPHSARHHLALQALAFRSGVQGRMRQASVHTASFSHLQRSAPV